MTQIILLQRKEVFKAWKPASKHICTKCSVEQTKCTVVPAQILHDPELKLRDFKGLHIPHCLAPPRGSLLSSPWRCSILPHLNPGNWFDVSTTIFKPSSPNISESLALVFFSSRTIYHL